METDDAKDTLLKLAAFVAVVAGLRYAGAFVVPILLAACMAAATAPVAFWFKRRGAPSWAGPVAAVLIDLGVIALVVILLVVSAEEFETRLPDYTQRLAQATMGLSAWLAQRQIFVSADALYKLADPAALLPYVGTTLSSLAAMVSELVLVLLITFFALFELSTFREKLGAIVSDPEADVRRAGSVVHEVQRYLVVKSLLSLATAAVVGTVLAILKLDFVVLLAVAAFFLNFIPNLGGILSAFPAILVALVQRGPGAALGVTIAYLAAHLVIGNIVEPRVLGRTMGLSPLVVLLSMIFWGWMWGAAGALLSVPLTMVVKILLAEREELRWIAVLLGPPGAKAKEGAGMVKVRNSLLDHLPAARRSRET